MDRVITEVTMKQIAAVGVVVVLTISAAWTTRAETIDPAGTGSRFAYAENAGWINAEPLGDGGPGMHLTDGSVSGWMWSENLGWISLSCTNTGSCNLVSYGVVNDSAGNLSGFAWSENAGWISFSCENTSSCAVVDYGVVADPQNGSITGFAWSENVGWLSLSCINTASCANVLYGVETSAPFPQSIIFADGFESGDLGAWSVSAP